VIRIKLVDRTCPRCRHEKAISKYTSDFLYQGAGFCLVYICDNCRYHFTDHEALRRDNVIPLAAWRGSEL
jgi:C4-type Zn-finger protein